MGDPKRALDAIERFFRSTVVMWGAIGVIGGSYVYGRIDEAEATVQESIPNRVQAMETAFAAHLDTTTTPALAQIRNLQEQVEALPEIRAMVYELWCDRFPERCQAAPVPRMRP